jgi:hypothetical protein
MITARWSERAGLWGYLVFFAVFGAIMTTKVSNIAGGADPSCYLELSRLFMHGTLTTELRPVAGLPLEAYPAHTYAPISYAAKPDHSGLVPTGFPGLPLLYSAFDVFLPTPIAIKAVVWLTLMGCGGLLFLLLRELGFGSAWAAVGAIAMGLAPVVVLIGSNPMTDPLTCCLASLAWLLALRADRSRRWALALGFTLGFAVLTRSTNVLFFPPIALVLLSRGWRQVSWLFVVLGGLPAAIFMFTYNTAVHGGPLASTGYSDVWHLFNRAQFTASMKFYVHWLHVLWFPAAISFAPLALLWVRREPWLVATICAWVVGFVGFYAFYYASSEAWWILRYILPGVVALIVASTLVLHRSEAWLTNRFRLARWRGVVPLLLAVAAVAYGSHQGRKLGAYGFLRNELVIHDVMRWVQDSTTRDDVFLAFNSSASLHYYTDRAFLRWDLLDAAGWEKIQLATSDEAEIYGIFYLFEFGDPGTIAGRLPGKWEMVFRTHDTAIAVFKLVRSSA